MTELKCMTLLVQDGLGKEYNIFVTGAEGVTFAADLDGGELPSWDYFRPLPATTWRGSPPPIEEAARRMAAATIADEQVWCGINTNMSSARMAEVLMPRTLAQLRDLLPSELSASDADYDMNLATLLARTLQLLVAHAKTIRRRSHE